MNNNNKRESLNIIDRPIITDKTTKFLENNQYCFYVKSKAKKLEIKNAIEYLFNVKVKKVHTLHPPRKKQTVGHSTGIKPHYKKAIITLHTDNRIDLFADNS
uniref:Large ribosomal subunit protein uL23c n=1 Tax=Rhodogorgon sp. TaxID=2485824 RepID=A0A3G3MHX4_9FLOR|nr:ribosomal protein L23 [Rhodogorgon sp.]